jgi:hypothetical protein
LIILKRKRRATTDAVEILDRRYYKGKPKRLAGLEDGRANDHVARKIVALRTEGGLSQRQLARLVVPTASVIAVLKTPTTKGTPWRGSILSLKRRVEIRFVPVETLAVSMMGLERLGRRVVAF